MHLGQPIDKLRNGSITLLDACYYVDDFRIVLSVPKGMDEEEIGEVTTNWLKSLIEEHAPGLRIQGQKTKVTVEGRDKRFLVPQSKSAKRIQKEVSNTFDMLHGSELIETIEGFFHTQKRYPESDAPLSTGRSGLLVGMSDMRDDTAARFAAGKYLRAYRLLRPLLEASSLGHPEREENPDEEDEEIPPEITLAKEQLDEKAKVFAALLIEEWMSNPANVRLLRVALNLFPDVNYLDHVLTLLAPAVSSEGGKRGPRREVLVYCLTEIFRAGATETGMVQDGECLPDLNVEDYHSKLTQSAVTILESFIAHKGSQVRFPWYLMQQVFLYLSARDAFPETALNKLKTKGGPLLERYRHFALFLNSQIPYTLENRAIFLGIASTGFGHGGSITRFSGSNISSEFLTEVYKMSPTIGRCLWAKIGESANPDLLATANSLGLSLVTSDIDTVASIARKEKNPFLEEENILELAIWLLSLPDDKFIEKPLTPWNVETVVVEGKGFTFGRFAKDSEPFRFKHAPSRMGSMFSAPSWCETLEEKKKYNIGLILRYAVSGGTGLFSNSFNDDDYPLKRYKAPISHWEQQRYSIYQGRSAFGPPWLPLGSSTEDLLFQLLRWPGCGLSKPEASISKLLEDARNALIERKKDRGDYSSVTFLKQAAPWPDKPSKDGEASRALRIGIVQSVIPSDEDYGENLQDPELNGSDIRQRQRSHLAAIMDGVAQMLRVRESHRTQDRPDGRIIDLLFFPELAVHPNDIDPIIMPFVRTHRCIVLFGQVFHRNGTGESGDLINSAMWLIPKWSRADGLQIERIEQGKQYLAPTEESAGFIPPPVGFRPAQWLIEYEWSRNENDRPLTLSASICYDATDLGLAADLRTRSDLYIICALNRDVGTFDRMSEGLHYHMYQGVVLVNNGNYGGSNFYMPLDKPHQRQIFHVHGQPQVSISFAEISPRKLLNRRNPTIYENRECSVPIEDDDYPTGNWKSPPAPST